MADYSLPRIKESALPEATNVDKVRVLDSTGKSVWVEKEDLPIIETQVTGLTDDLALKADKSVEIIAGAGLTGGGALAGDVTLNVVTADDSLVVAADNVKVNTVDALTSDSATRPLSAKQGKALNLAKVGLTGNETIAGVKTFSSSPIVPTPTMDMQASTKKYGDDILAAYGVDVNNVCGAVNHYKRVLADAGGILDRSWLLKVYEEYIKQRPETVRLYIPELGTKERVSGLNKYGAKVYDMSTVQSDASQATEATQPYMTINAAPNARKGIRFVQGQTQTGLLDFTDVAFAAGDSWTLIIRLKINKKGNAIIYLSAGRFIELTPTIFFLNNGSVNIMGVTYNFECGKTYTIECQYSNGAGLIVVNSIPQVTTVNSGTMVFGQVSYVTSYPLDCVLYALHLTNTRKSAYQSQLDHTFLSTLFPDMESVAIGNQVWATDNFAGTVAGDGTVIPEVQSAVTAADATNIYNTVYASTSGSAAVKDLAATKAAAMWCHYDNLAANGAVYGKHFNGYSVKLLDKYPLRGYRIPSYASVVQLVTLCGSPTIAAKKLKATGVTYWASGNTGTNEAGFSAIASGVRGVDGTFADAGNKFVMWTSDGYLVTFDYNADTVTYTSGADPIIGASIRLLRNEPAGVNELSYTSGLFTTDITSAAKQIPISFGRMVDAIRIKTENALTGIEAKLHNSAGTAVATLITGKSVSAGATMVFPVSADYAALLQDGTVRVTASGNSGAAVGMEIEVLTHKSVL